MPDIKVNDAPPSNRKNSPAKAPKQTLTDARTEALLGVAQIVQMPLGIFHWTADAQAVENHAPALCSEIAKLADANPAMAARIDKLSAVGPYTALFVAALGFSAQLAVNHGLIPAGVAGTVPSELLVQQAQVRAAQAQVQLAQMQQEAQEQMLLIKQQMAETEQASQNQAVHEMTAA